MSDILRELRKVYVDIPDVEITVTPGYKFGVRGIYDWSLSYIQIMRYNFKL